MTPRLQTVLRAFIFISIIFTVRSQDDPDDPDPVPGFPKMSEIEIEFYQTDVQVTNEDQQIAAFASEYHDKSGAGVRGRVDVLVLGDRQSIFYYNETNEILEVNSTSCKAWDIDESIYDYQPIFYGWLNKDPLVIGPSAPLWYADANRKRIVSVGEAVVRGINCQKFSLTYETDRDKVTFYYYFAGETWKTPYNVDGLRVPLRIEVRGTSSVGAAKADQFYPVNQLTDFAFFRPDIADWRVFQPPEGLGCPLRKVTKDMPTMPKVYRYSAEVVDLLKADENEMSDIEYQQVWYDGVEQLARLDKYTRMRYTSEFYDFNTGVTYSMVDGRTCDIKPLRNSFFEGYDGQMIGHLKEPGEVLGLDDKFYFMGKKLIRGIWCDVFERAQTDVTFMKQDLVKLVITIYYSKEYYEVAVDGETETRVPVFYAVKGWETPNKVSINLQYNIFAFDDVIYPDMYASFRLGRCFPSMKDKSYFILIMDVDIDTARKMEGQDDYMTEQLRAQIINNAKVSNQRLPLLRVDYKSTGVYVTGLMLDRPPALKQFWFEYEGKDATTNDPYLKVSPTSDTLEKCAFACVDEGDFTCTGFFFCDKACFIKSKDILELNDNKTNNYNFQGPCQEWLRAERFSTNKEAYLIDALKSLEDAVLNLTVKISVKEGETSELIVPVSDIVIGDGPYTGVGNQEKPYDLVISLAKLDPNDETTEQLNYIETLSDCYTACKKSKDVTCSSFSYCPDSSNKQCSLSSVLVEDRKTNLDDTLVDKNCNVYSMKYLDFYDAYPGRVALIPGADVITDVKSPEQCAMKCRTAKNVVCRGFEFCQNDKNCVLHTKHVLDLNPGEVINSKKTNCIHYAARYAADYLDMGLTLLDDNSDVRKTLTLEECSKICSEELKDKCSSFNYCPASSPYAADSSCALTSLTLTSPRITTTTKPPCHHYEKKSKVDDWGSYKSKNKPITSGYTTSGFTWLVIGMLILGFGLGAVGFVVYSYYRSKSSGEGMTVRFMKNDQI